MAEMHDHSPVGYHHAFALGLFLNIGFVIFEAAFGILAGSLALLADAGHNLSDVIGLGLAWVASLLMMRPPTERRTYGWRRSSILAALVNALLLLVAVGAIGWEAVRRLWSPAPVAGMTILWVSAVGVAVNTATALLFLRGRKQDLNIRAAFSHMAADAGVSAGVVLAGLIIAATGWMWVDPVISLVIVGVILFSTWGLLHESMNLALDAVPDHIDTERVRAYLCGLPGVVAVHDLHIWGLSTTETALTAHLVKPDPKDDDRLITTAARELHDRFGIKHATLQWEREPGTYLCDVPRERKE
jgi:cobalt-zinc-cadmium efflux system protein